MHANSSVYFFCACALYFSSLSLLIADLATSAFIADGTLFSLTPCGKYPAYQALKIFNDTEHGFVTIYFEQYNQSCLDCSGCLNAEYPHVWHCAPSATEDTTVSATDGADEFRYEFSGSTSSEGNFIITIDGFDTANDKIVLVNVGGDDLTTTQFKELSGVEVSGNSFDNQTRILFDKDSSGGSGELAINGVYDSDLTTITIEILSDTSVVASTSGDFG